jgi:hypothetical protein
MVAVYFLATKAFFDCLRSCVLNAFNQLISKDWRTKKELKFIINCHTSGNDFIWPYNGREPNDIETRSPGYLAIF